GAVSLVTGAFVPRRRSRIWPGTRAGSTPGGPPFPTAAKQRRTAVALAPGRPASVERMKGAGPTGAASEAPLNVALLPKVTEPTPLRLWVPAAAVVIHGPGLVTVPAPGPALPAAAQTKTPASAANRNETCSGERNVLGGEEGPTE